ncbi:MAG: hypothetical protein AB4038_09225 [Prochloraceae cyanobacterium]
MSTKFVALLAPKLAVTGLTSAGSQRPATDSDMLIQSTTYIALTFELPNLKILRTKGYLCKILFGTTLYLYWSWFISLLGFFTRIVSCTSIIQQPKVLLDKDVRQFSQIITPIPP